MKIRIQDLVKRYGTKEALRGISLSVGEGEIFGFIGPNGAGKTTTLSILVGLIGFDSGVCGIDGLRPRRGIGVGYLPWYLALGSSKLGTLAQADFLPSMLCTAAAVVAFLLCSSVMLERTEL